MEQARSRSTAICWIVVVEPISDALSGQTRSLPMVKQVRRLRL